MIPNKNVNESFQDYSSYITPTNYIIMCNWLVVSARHEKRAKRNMGRYERTNLSHFGIGHRVVDGKNIILIQKKVKS